MFRNIFFWFNPTDLHVLNILPFKAQEQQNRHLEIVKAKEELAKKNQEVLQLHSLLNETEQLLVGYHKAFTYGCKEVVTSRMIKFSYSKGRRSTNRNTK